MSWLFRIWPVEYIIERRLPEFHWMHVKNKVARLTIRIANIGIIPKLALFLFFNILNRLVDVGDLHAVKKGGHETSNWGINHLFGHIILHVSCLLSIDVDVEVTNAFKNKGHVEVFLWVFPVTVLLDEVGTPLHIKLIRFFHKFILIVIVTIILLLTSILLNKLLSPAIFLYNFASFKVNSDA